MGDGCEKGNELGGSIYIRLASRHAGVAKVRKDVVNHDVIQRVGARVGELQHVATPAVGGRLSDAERTLGDRILVTLHRFGQGEGGPTGGDGE